MVKHSRNTIRDNKHKHHHSRKSLQSKHKYTRRVKKRATRGNKGKHSIRRLRPRARNFNPPIIVSAPTSNLSSISAQWSPQISSPEMLESGTDMESNMTTDNEGIIFGDENSNSLHLSDLNTDMHLSELNDTLSANTDQESDM